jgi:hypothetical protein
MVSPATDPWPATAAEVNAVDSEGDGKPSVTVFSKSGPVPGMPGQTYADFPVDATKLNRADRIYVAARQVVALDGTVDNCSEMHGTLSVATISGKRAVDSRIMGCRLDSSAHPDCNATQTKFIDDNQPVLTPSDTDSSFISKRVGPSASTCADIRAALPLER